MAMKSSIYLLPPQKSKCYILFITVVEVEDSILGQLIALCGASEVCILPATYACNNLIRAQ